jgi:molecular chaperone DnaK
MINIGFDLGTTYSLAAFVNSHGVPALFPDYHDANEFRTSSVVHIDNNNALIGSVLEELLEEEPDLNIARFIKLAMGTAESVLMDDQKRDWRAEGLSALILAKLLKDIRAFAPEDLGNCVITVPANFKDAQKKSTLDAAKLAGIKNALLIDEPVAAATFYGVTENAGEQTLFVYDLGGGTFDATILQTSPEGLFALATDGHNELGGKSIDDLIIDEVSKAFRQAHGADLLKDTASKQQLRRFATETKLALSKPGRGQVRKTLLLAGKTLDYCLSRSQFDRMIEPLIDESLKISNRCLEGAGLSWDMIDRILLTGGSSLIPMVNTKLRDFTGMPAGKIISRQPHQAVAYGAAIIADQKAKKQQDENEQGGLIQQISAYDLGIRVMDKQTKQPTVQVLISRNSPLPATNTTTFYTTRPDQHRMIIEGVQSKGDDAVESLGFFAFGPISRPRKNYPVEITLSYDADGIIKIKARDPETGSEMDRILEADDQAELAHLAQHRDWIKNIKINQ